MCILVWIQKFSITSGFREKVRLKPLGNNVIGLFKKIVDLNTDVLEPYLLSGIALENEPKSKLIACILKVGDRLMSRGAKEKETHKGP